jgi:hypothetical protein
MSILLPVEELHLPVEALHLPVEGRAFRFISGDTHGRFVFISVIG